MPPRARIEEMPKDEAELLLPWWSTDGPEGTLLTRARFAQAIRAPPALWITMERFPAKAPMPGLVETYKSVY